LTSPLIKRIFDLKVYWLTFEVIGTTFILGNDKMAKEKRWKQAQSFEKSFWCPSGKKLGQNGFVDYSWYQWRAGRISELVAKAKETEQASLNWNRVLEIGSGPVGTSAYLNGAERYALDPLCDYYTSQPALIKYRSDAVTYINGKGEKLPFESEYFDLVVIENVIDHVENMESVVNEIYRVLKPGAILYLTVNLHPTWGAFLHRIFSFLLIDRGHPHTFKISSIRNFLTGHGFQILYNEWEDYTTCRKQDFESKSGKNKIKAVLGLSEFLFTSVSQKAAKI
jgi:SAM-dependent methyltransferase